MQYTSKKFDLPSLDGISEKQIEVHIGLYEGYVKHINLLREQIAELTALNKEKYAYAITETRRRLGFEFNGMRMHELYFSQWEGKKTDSNTDGALARAVAEKYGSWEQFLEHFKTVGMSRGIGWTILYYDPEGNSPAGEVHTAWITDHELGQLGSLPVILAMDMWEHAYMVDYLPAEKKQYIEAFFKNLNWPMIEERFAKVA
ncbi:superoxide dismutase [Candidatus Kaiserbacteria bacterium]|nr:superoxide dismutase [Candidatus Kaiserbacteria bacterium]